MVQHVQAHVHEQRVVEPRGVGRQPPVRARHGPAQPARVVLRTQPYGVHVGEVEFPDGEQRTGQDVDHGRQFGRGGRVFLGGQLDELGGDPVHVVRVRGRGLGFRCAQEPLYEGCGVGGGDADNGLHGHRGPCGVGLLWGQG